MGSYRQEIKQEEKVKTRKADNSLIIFDEFGKLHKMMETELYPSFHSKLEWIDPLGNVYKNKVRKAINHHKTAENQEKEKQKILGEIKKEKYFLTRITEHRNRLDSILRDLSKNIEMANMCPPGKNDKSNQDDLMDLVTYIYRRHYMDQSIILTKMLLGEFDFIKGVFPGVELKKYDRYVASIKYIRGLLEGWRKYDNTRRKELESKLINNSKNKELTKELINQFQEGADNSIYDA